MTQYYDDNGDFEYTAKSRCSVQIQTTCEFFVAVNGRLNGPRSSNDRYLMVNLNSGDVLSVNCTERYSIQVKDLAPRGETPNPESMCEIIEDKELDLYERLKADMFAKLSQYAESKDMDTFKDDNDLDWDEADAETPLTPYEHVEMYPEYYNPPSPTPSQADEIVPEKIAASPQSENTEAPTLSEEPA